MNQLLSFVERFSGLIFLLVSAQLLIPPPSIRQRLEADSQFAASDRRLRRKIFAYNACVWLVMFAGQLFAGKSAFEYIRPGQKDPWVIGWSVSIAIFWLVTAYWVYVRDGAGVLAEHGFVNMRGVRKDSVFTPAKVKIFVGFAILVNVVGYLILFFRSNV